MENSRVTSVVNLYLELKRKDEKFKDVEPCFIQGGDALTILWTTASQEGGGGGANVDIDEDEIKKIIETAGATGEKKKPTKEGVIKKSGEGKGKGEGGEGKSKGEAKGKGEGEGKEKGEGQGEGKGEGQGEGGDEGEGQGEGKEGGDEQGEGQGEGGDEGQGEGGDEGRHGKKPSDEEGGEDEDEREGAGQREVESRVESEDEQEVESSETPEQLLAYQFKYPTIFKTFFDVDLYNASGDRDWNFGKNEVFTTLKSRVEIGCAITMYKTLVQEGRKYGESILAMKKQISLEFIKSIYTIFNSSKYINSEGKLHGWAEAQFTSSAENMDTLRQMVNADKMTYLVLPNFLVFNSELFNQNALVEYIKFCFSFTTQTDSFAYFPNITEDSIEMNFGVVVRNGESRKTYEFVAHESSFDGKREVRKQMETKTLVKYEDNSVVMTESFNNMSEVFKNFIQACVYAYFSNSTEDVGNQRDAYKAKMNKNLESFSYNVMEVLRIFEK